MDYKVLLSQLPCNLLHRDAWYKVGAALHHEGCDVSVWDDWSRQDAEHYVKGECERYWSEFTDDRDKVAGGEVILDLIKQNAGFKPKAASDFRDAADGPRTRKAASRRRRKASPAEAQLDGEMVRRSFADVRPGEAWDGVADAVAYLKAMFKADERVDIITRSFLDPKRQKWTPIPANNTIAAGELIKRLESCGGDITKVLGPIDVRAGVWTRINPVDGILRDKKGKPGEKCRAMTDDNVTAWRYVLVESDEQSLDEQLSLIYFLQLPCAAVVYSGSKSIHCAVHVDAHTQAEYDDRRKLIYDFCNSHGFTTDEQDKNPSRMTRLPGVQRGDDKQFLIATNVGPGTFDEWWTWVESHCPAAAGDEAGGDPAEAGGGKGFDHAAFGDALIEEDHIIKLDGALNIWDGRQYTADKDAINAAMIARWRNIKRNQRVEVQAYLEAVAPRLQAADPRYITFRNGVLDIESMKVAPHNPLIVSTNLIPWVYEKDAKSEVLDGFLDGISCGDVEIQQMLLELVGLCLYRSNKAAMSIVLVGNGANGKSTFIKMLTHFLGMDNISCLSLEDLSTTFRPAGLVGKLANLGDDIDDAYIKDLAIFRKLVTGERLTVERKGQDPFTFCGQVKFIFSCNSLPTLRDATGAVLGRRLLPVPFLAKFLEGKRDVNLTSKLASSECMSALAAKAVEGLRDLLHRGALFKPAKVKEALREYQVTNDSLASWLDEYDDPAAAVVGSDTKALFIIYENYCSENCLRALSNIQFSRKVNERIGTQVQEYRDKDGKKRKRFIKV